jgi:hypothetical protein
MEGLLKYIYRYIPIIYIGYLLKDVNISMRAKEVSDKLSLFRKIMLNKNYRKRVISKIK